MSKNELPSVSLDGRALNKIYQRAYLLRSEQGDPNVTMVSDCQEAGLVAVAVYARAALQRELEQERARSAALDELVGEYEAQWGDDYLAKKWELKEQRVALKKPDGEAAK